MNNSKRIAPVHPGEILMEEFLKPLQISQYKIAKDMNVSPTRINEIIHGIRAISSETALRLARYFGTSPDFWINLQSRYDLEVESEKIDNKLTIEVKVFDFNRFSKITLPN